MNALFGSSGGGYGCGFCDIAAAKIKIRPQSQPHAKPQPNDQLDRSALSDMASFSLVPDASPQGLEPNTTGRLLI